MLLRCLSPSLRSLAAKKFAWKKYC